LFTFGRGEKRKKESRKKEFGGPLLGRPVAEEMGAAWRQ